LQLLSTNPYKFNETIYSLKGLIKMEINKTKYGDVAVISVSGNIKGCPEAEVIHESIKELLAEDMIKLIVDLSDVHWVGSVGIGAIIGGLTTVRHSGGDLRLVGINIKIQNLLTITKLDGLFRVFGSIDDAVDSFSAPPVSMPG
jgi:anti-sigma B factor antagonist